MPSKRSPVSGSSAVKSGWPRCTSAPTWAATSRMMRSPSASGSSTPNGVRPDDSRSTHRVRSGLSMISTTSGSSSAVAISGPIAVRSIWMRRSSEVAADERGSGGICGTALMRHAPALLPAPPRHPSAPARDTVLPPHRAPGCAHAAGAGPTVRRTARSAPCLGAGRVLMGFGHRRADGQEVADEQRQRFDLDVLVALHALGLPRQAIQPLGNRGFALVARVGRQPGRQGSGNDAGLRHALSWQPVRRGV